LKLHIFLTRTIFYHIFSVFMQKDLKKWRFDLDGLIFLKN